MARILVIDDDVDLLGTIRRILEMRGGYEVTISADGSEGLAKALADPPDLAIIDVMMPRISGYEVCGKLRADPRTAALPIIIFTARGQPVDREAALEVGADAYLPKPVPMEDLLGQVARLLSRQAAERSHLLAGTVMLLSLRGGVGVTTLAVNLAATLTQVRDGAVCLVDMCPSSGHVALQLGIRPEPNWSDLLDITIPDTVDVQGLLLTHDSGLQVLASPVVPVLGQGLPRMAVETALGILQQQFSVVVVDAPSVLDEVTMSALEAATVVGLVITAETPSIQMAIGTLRALRPWSDKLQIILNQVTPGAPSPAEAIERMLRRPILGMVPFDPAQAQALAQRAPLAVRTPSSPLVQAVRSLVEKTIH